MTRAERMVEEERAGFEKWWGDNQAEWQIPEVPLSAWIDIKQIVFKAYLAGIEHEQNARDAGGGA